MNTIFKRMVAGIGALAALSLMGVGDSPVVSAATLTVTDASGDPLVVGSLPYQVAQANASVGVADTIDFDPGLFNSGSPQLITLNTTLDIDDTVTIQGPGSDAVTVTTATGPVIRVDDASNPSLTITGLTLGGSDDAALDVIQRGSSGPDLELRVSGVVFDSNVTGIDAFATALVDIDDSVFSGHSGPFALRAFSPAGGETPVIDLNTVEFADNVGRAIDVSDVDTVTFDSVTVHSDGLATPAGQGIRIGDATAPIEIIDTTIRDQDASGANGLLIFGSDSTVSLTDSSIMGITSSGLSAYDVVGEVVVTGSTLSGNDIHGADLRGPGPVTFRQSITDENASDGASLSSTGGVTITDHTARGNSRYGLDVGSATAGVSVSGGNFDENLAGINVSNASGLVRIAGVAASRNTSTGVSVFNFGAPPPRPTVEVVDVTLDDNASTGLSITASGAVSISGSSLDDNDFRGATITDTTTITMADTTFDRNDTGLFVNEAAGQVSMSADVVARSNTRAGLHVINSAGDVTLENTTVGDNGTYGLQLDDVGAVSFVDGSIDANGDDGAWIRQAGPVSIDGATVSRNTRAGIRLDTTGAAEVDSTSLVGNGDGIVVTDVADGLEVLNSSIFDNTGFAASVRGTRTEVSVRHSTIDQNAADTAISTDRNLVLDHSIVLAADGFGSEGNSFRLVTPSGGAAPTVTSGYSILERGTGLGGTNLEIGDADLGPVDASGPTPVLPPNPTSPAVGAGDPAISGAPATDQLGGPREIGVIDIGAVEILTKSLEPLSPDRFADTRSTGETVDGRFEAEGKLAAEEQYEVQIAGRGLVPANAEGVIMNVTAVAAEGNGFVTVHPCVTPRPLASSLNYTTGVNLGNEVIAGLSETGSVCLFTRRAAHLTVDVTGFIPKGSSTMLLTPARLLETRPGLTTADGLAQGGGRTEAGGTTVLDVAGRVGIPDDAAAVIVNVTAVGAQQRGFVTVHPCVDPAPVASSLNYVPGVNRGNELVATLDAKGGICLFTNRSIHLNVDVVGYLPAEATLRPVDPARLLDTRPGKSTIDGESAGAGRVAAESTTRLEVAGRADVPDGATAAILNVTAIGATERGFVTVHPCVDQRPLASSLNYVSGVNGANEIVATLDGKGDICLFTNRSINLAVDVVGFVT